MVELTLKALTEFFTTQGFPCETLKATKEVPFDFLFVSLGEEEGGGGSVLQLRISKQDIDTKEDSVGFPMNEQGYYYMQFTMPMKVEVKESAMWDLSRLILLANLSNELPGFEFSELDKVVFYRYSLLVPGPSIDPYLIMTIVGNALTMMMTFGDNITEVASGKKTLKEIYEEIKKGKEDQEKDEKDQIEST